MIVVNLVKAPNGAAVLPAETDRAYFHTVRILKPIFTGPTGLRAGWRLLVFLVLLAVPAAGLYSIAHAHGAHPERITITPFLMGSNEALEFVILCVATWIMGRIERRKFIEYGLSLRQAFGKDFRFGALLGFLAV